jgi:ankyrin repeat protein
MEDPFLLLRYGQLDQLKELISANKVSIQQTRWSGFTLLHRAAEIGCDADILSFLVKCGISVNVRSAKGWYTPLHIALGNGYLETATALVELGADPWTKNKDDENSFDFGVKRGFRTQSEEFRTIVTKKEINKTAFRYLSTSKENQRMTS